jgi:hypothetical protein
MSSQITSAKPDNTAQVSKLSRKPEDKEQQVAQKDPGQKYFKSQSEYKKTDPVAAKKFEEFSSSLRQDRFSPKNIVQTNTLAILNRTKIINSQTISEGDEVIAQKINPQTISEGEDVVAQKVNSQTISEGEDVVAQKMNSQTITEGDQVLA